MKIPLVYPKIPNGENCPLKQCIAFEKLDGTNFHWVLQDANWTSYGTRRDSFLFNQRLEFNAAHPGLEQALPIFFHKFSHSLTDKLTSLGITNAIVFTEFWGKESFAGQHVKDDPKHHTIIDIQVDKRIVSPSEFIQIFKNFEAKAQSKHSVARIIYNGKYTGQFVEDVRKGKYQVEEGVVCKGIVKGEVCMTKIKTNAYMQKLKDSFKEDWKNYWE